MTLTVLFIAALHGFVILVVAAASNSKLAVAIAAIVAAVIAVRVGNPVYAAFDLLAVAGATYFCWTGLTERERPSRQEIAAAKEKARLERLAAEQAAARAKAAASDSLGGVLIVAAIVGIVIWKPWATSAPSPTAPQSVTAPQPVTAPAVAAPMQPAASHPSVTKPTARKQPHTAKPPAAKKHPIEQCLALPNEQAMVRCLEHTE